MYQWGASVVVMRDAQRFGIWPTRAQCIVGSGRTEARRLPRPGTTNALPSAW
jgi:hypothetical protein